jgi:preprotein translocase subunit SecE
LKKALTFVKEVRTEMSKVTWPGRQELVSSTSVVIFSVLMVAVFIGVVDLGLTKTLGLILR